MSNKLIAGAMIVAALFVGWALLQPKGATLSPSQAPTAGSNITMENGKQIITISVKGGYQPRLTTAKAGIPTVLRMDTNSTFDCSATMRIPSLGVSKTLPPSGSTDIDIGTPAASTLQGICVMGMYSYQVVFQ